MANVLEAAKRLIPILESMQPGETITTTELTGYEVSEAAYTFLEEALENSDSSLNPDEFTFEFNHDDLKKRYDQPFKLNVTRKREAQ